jgi:hypothetical protein
MPPQHLRLRAGVRRTPKSALLSAPGRLPSTDEGRVLLTSSLDGLLWWPPGADIDTVTHLVDPAV